MGFSLLANASEWSLFRIVFDSIIQTKSLDLMKWFLLAIVSQTISAYFGVRFFSTITTDVEQGLKYLFLLFVFENAVTYCSLREYSANKVFMLDFLKIFRTKINQRILSTNWIRIKLSDQEEIRRKIEDGISSVQYLVEESITGIKDLSVFLISIVTIFCIYPVAAIMICVIYACSYRFYLNKQSKQLLDVKLKMIEEYDRLSNKYSRGNANMFEYVIHHEKNKIIDMTNELKIDMERQWFDLDYLYRYLSFQEAVLGKICTFLTILIYYLMQKNVAFIIPLYQHLSTLTTSIDTLIAFYIRVLRLKKDYDLIQPILEEYEERINVEQIDLNYSLVIQDLSFRYQEDPDREPFHLQLNGTLTFNMGQSILITGKSGAGKSTFYDILNGSIPMKDYSAFIQIDDKQQSLASLHSIEKCRTMVLQDSHMDYRSTIFSMVTDIDEDRVETLRTPEHVEVVWEFLRLVQIDEFVKNELKGNLDEAMENKLSGGQKTRLLLARALYRAHHRHSSMLILDEPDKGLPAETTVTIIENIMKWYRSKGILFLTLHTERAHQLNFDQVLHVENGIITKIR